MKYGYYIIILLIFSSVVVDGRSNRSLLVRSNSIQPMDTQISNSIEYNLSTPVRGYKNSTPSVSHLNPLYLPASTVSNQILVEMTTSTRDIFSYYDQFSSQLSETSDYGGMYVNYHTDTYITSVANEGSDIPSHSSLDYELMLNGNETLFIDLSSFNYSLVETDRYYFSTIFNFAAGSIVIYHMGDPDYLNTLENTSSTINIIHENNLPLNVSLSDLSSILSEEDFSSLSNLKWVFYNNEYYEFKANFSKIQLLQSSNIMDLTQNSTVSVLNNITQISLDPGVDFYLHPIVSSEGNLRVSRYITHDIFTPGEITVSIQSLEFFGTQISDQFFDEYSYYLDYNDIFSQYQLHPDSNFESDNLIKINSSMNISWNLSGVFYFKNIDVQSSHHIQGEDSWFSWSEENNITLSFLYHRKSEEISTGQITGLNSSIPIPAHWAKGETILFILDANHYYSSHIFDLDLSPSRLSSNTEIQINPMITKTIPILIENLTSGVVLPATTIVSTYNNTVYRIDGVHGLLITAGDFDVGIHVLEINASISGMVPITFDFVLEVIPISANPSISARRSGEKSMELEVYLPEMVNWSINPRIQVVSEGINFTDQLISTRTVFSITSNNWEEDVSYVANITIFFRANNTIQNYLIDIEPWNPTNGISIITLLLGSFGISTGTLIYKIVSRRNGDDILEF